MRISITEHSNGKQEEEWLKLEISVVVYYYSVKLFILLLDWRIWCWIISLQYQANKKKKTVKIRKMVTKLIFILFYLFIY